MAGNAEADEMAAARAKGADGAHFSKWG